MPLGRIDPTCPVQLLIGRATTNLASGIHHEAYDCDDHNEAAEYAAKLEDVPMPGSTPNLHPEKLYRGLAFGPHVGVCSETSLMFSPSGTDAFSVNSVLLVGRAFPDGLDDEDTDHAQARRRSKRIGSCEPYLTACDTHAPLFWDSEPSATFAHTPLPNSSIPTLSPNSCFQVNFILALLVEHPISEWPERSQAYVTFKSGCSSKEDCHW
jgi:hypothetical protein